MPLPKFIPSLQNLNGAVRRATRFRQFVLKSKSRSDFRTSYLIPPTFYLNSNLRGVNATTNQNLQIKHLPYPVVCAIL